MIDDAKSLRQEIAQNEARLAQLKARLKQIETQAAPETARAWREEHNQTPRRFFKLPAELRNKIYHLVVPNEQSITHYGRSTRKELVMLQVCRQMRKDMVPIYYGNNTFAHDFRMESDVRIAQRWLKPLGNDTAAAIRKLRLSTVISCDCAGGWRMLGRDLSSRDVALVVKIDLNDRAAPFRVSLESCGKCRGRPMHLAAPIERLLDQFDLTKEETTLTQKDLRQLFGKFGRGSPPILLESKEFEANVAELRFTKDYGLYSEVESMLDKSNRYSDDEY